MTKRGKLATCPVCGGPIEAERQERDCGICRECASERGKLREVTIALRISTDPHSTILPLDSLPRSFPRRHDWATIRYKVKERWGQHLDTDLKVYNQLHDWLLSEYRQRQGELVPWWPAPESPTEWLLRVTLARVIEALKGDVAASKVSQPAPAIELNSGAAMAQTKIVQRLLRLYVSKIADERITRAAGVLASDGNANEKLIGLDRELRIPPTASAEDLGDLLEISKQAVMKTNWWKDNRRGARDETIEGRQNRLKERGRRMERPDDE